MEIRKATLEDINLLIQLRLDYLREDKGSLTEPQERAIVFQLRKYFRDHINRDFVALLAFEDNQAVSTAFLAVSEKPANPSFITGKTGTLLNVLTYPAYRRRGYAEKILCQIVEEAKNLNLSYIELSATPEGRPLYTKLGFDKTVSEYVPMKLQLL